MLPWFNKSKEQDSYEELKGAFDYEEGKNEDPLHGYNHRALEKRQFLERPSALEESEDCFDQVLEEEKLAIEKARKNKPKSRQAGKNIAEESVRSSFWSNLFR